MRAREVDVVVRRALARVAGGDTHALPAFDRGGAIAGLDGGRASIDCHRCRAEHQVEIVAVIGDPGRGLAGFPQVLVDAVPGAGASGDEGAFQLEVAERGGLARVFRVWPGSASRAVSMIRSPLV